MSEDSRSGTPAIEFKSRRREREHQDDGYFEVLQSIFGNNLFMTTMLAIGTIYFVVTGIQFWISDYLITVLKAPEEKVFMIFAFVSITAPTLGVIFGGKLSHRLGGYTGRHALLFCVIWAALGSIIAIPIPFLNSLLSVTVFLWLEFFIGGVILPTLTGFMISSIKKQARNVGSAFAQFIQHLTGYLPSPMLYGLIVKHTPSPGGSRWGMIMLMSWSLIGTILLFIAFIIQFRRRSRREKLKQKREKTANKHFQEDISTKKSAQPASHELQVVEVGGWEDDYEDNEDYSDNEAQQEKQENPFMKEGRGNNIALLYDRGIRSTQNPQFAFN